MTPSTSGSNCFNCSIKVMSMTGRSVRTSNFPRPANTCIFFSAILTIAAISSVSAEEPDAFSRYAERMLKIDSRNLSSPMDVTLEVEALGFGTRFLLPDGVDNFVSEVVEDGSVIVVGGTFKLIAPDRISITVPCFSRRHKAKSFCNGSVTEEGEVACSLLQATSPTDHLIYICRWSRF